MPRGRPKGSRTKIHLPALNPEDPSQTTIGGVDPPDAFWDEFRNHILGQRQKDEHIMGLISKLNNETIPDIMKHVHRSANPTPVQTVYSGDPRVSEPRIPSNWFS